MRKVYLAAAVLLIAGCDREPSAAEQAAQDARDVQMVKDAQKRIPPVRKLTPEPMPMAEAAGSKVMGGGCGFRPAGQESDDPILFSDEERGIMRIDGQTVVLAADSGSAAFPHGSRSHYNGKEHDLRLTKEPGNGTPDGAKGTNWDAMLTLRDRWDRPAFVAAGTLHCSS